jgi:hypothetical protein
VLAPWRDTLGPQRFAADHQKPGASDVLLGAELAAQDVEMRRSKLDQAEVQCATQSCD